MKFGTHNLHDETGDPTPFADIIVFTEAIPAKIKATLGQRGYVVVTCRRQKDLVIAYKRNGKFRRTLRPAGYKKIHDGIAKVTPHRGTFWVHGMLDGKPAVIIAEHRINAAFPPFVRGENGFRAARWDEHTDFTVSLIRRFKRRKKIILAAGDLNTPKAVDGYRKALAERGVGFDRVGVHGMHASAAHYLSRAGSDHRRLYVELF